MDDVVLGYTDPHDYFYDGPCAGKIPGRYANRIARGRYSIDGTEYTLAINNGPNALHGGPEGFQNRVWDCAIEGDSVVFSYRSADGEGGLSRQSHRKSHVYLVRRLPPHSHPRSRDRQANCGKPHKPRLLES